MWLRCKSVVLGRFSWITLEKDNVFYIILALDVFVSSLVKCVVDMDLRVSKPVLSRWCCCKKISCTWK